MKRKNIIILLFVVFIAFVLIFTWQRIIGPKILEKSWVHSYEMVKISSKICDYITENYNFKTESVSNPGHPPISSEMSYLPTITIYTITQKSEQNKIVSLVQKYIKNNPIESTIVKFYDKENWIVKKDTSGKVRGGSRGKENLIRKVEIEENNITEK